MCTKSAIAMENMDCEVSSYYTYFYLFSFYRILPCFIPFILRFIYVVTKNFVTYLCISLCFIVSFLNNIVFLGATVRSGVGPPHSRGF